MTLLVGKEAPDFSLEGTTGRLGLKDLKGSWSIIFFYPKARTSVCQSEVVGFNAEFEDFSSLGVKIVGISVDDLETLKSWADELGGLQFPLLSDASHTVSEAYGVFSEKDGLAYRGLFILDPEGRIRYQVIQEPFFGRSSEEVKRIIQALQNGGPCPFNWKPVS